MIPSSHPEGERHVLVLLDAAGGLALVIDIRWAIALPPRDLYLPRDHVVKLGIAIRWEMKGVRDGSRP